MTPQLFAHPFSSYCQKVLIALYENDTPFEFRMLGPDQPENQAELRRLWPIGKFPLLRDGARPYFLEAWLYANDLAWAADLVPNLTNVIDASVATHQPSRITPSEQETPS